MEKTQANAEELELINKFITTHNKWRRARTDKSAKTHSDTLVGIMSRAEKEGWLTPLTFATHRHLETLEIERMKKDCE